MVKNAVDQHEVEPLAAPFPSDEVCRFKVVAGVHAAREAHIACMDVDPDVASGVEEVRELADATAGVEHPLGRKAFEEHPESRLRSRVAELWQLAQVVK